MNELASLQAALAECLRALNMIIEIDGNNTISKCASTIAKNALQQVELLLEEKASNPPVSEL